MLLRHSLELPKEAERVEQAVEQALVSGYRTKDIQSPGTRLVGTGEMTAQVVHELDGLYR
jgi:3-isopropylmalate dehydrogenase